jgi:hypothetical protein
MEETLNKLEQEGRNSKEAGQTSNRKIKDLQALIEKQSSEWKNRSTTLVYVIKSGTVYPINTHASIETFVKIVLKRFKNSNIDADDPSSFFPIEQGDKSPTDLLQVLTGFRL